MKIFNNFFWTSDNHRGFMEVFDSVDNEKLKNLIGEYDTTTIKLFDMFIDSQIGLLNISPIIERIDEENTTTESKQTSIINMFILLHYNELLKVKAMLLNDLSINDSVIEETNNKITTTSVNKLSSFNSDDLNDDNENNYNSNADNTKKQTNSNTVQTIKNIDYLTRFYLQSIYDKILFYIKDMCTLQVAD